jgi:hypothetical protein
MHREAVRVTEMNDLIAVMAKARSKRIVLTATAGRTGTAFASELFGTLPDTLSVHEPHPDFVSVMRRVQTAPHIAEQFLLHCKLPTIGAIRERVYVETSHLCCKGFLESFLKLGFRPSLLLLRRAPRQVAFSLLSRDTVPGRTPLGWMYLLAPGDPNTMALPGAGDYSDYQLCFWYALEIERRQERYAAMFQKASCPLFDATAEELGDFAVWRQAVMALGLGAHFDADAAAARHAEVTTTIWNKNPSTFSGTINFDAEEEAVWRIVDHYDPMLRDTLALRYAAFSPAAHNDAMAPLAATS